MFFSIKSYHVFMWMFERKANHSFYTWLPLKWTVWL